MKIPPKVWLGAGGLVFALCLAAAAILPQLIVGGSLPPRHVLQAVLPLGDGRILLASTHQSSLDADRSYLTVTANRLPLAPTMTATNTRAIARCDWLRIVGLKDGVIVVQIPQYAQPEAGEIEGVRYRTEHVK